MQEPAAGPADPVVRLAGVSVDIERVPVLRGVDLTVHRGESVGLVGPNGSGKTTLLRLLATLLTPARGQARLFGAEFGSRECDALRPRIAFVGHTPALYAQLTLRENLRFLARLTGRPDAAADEALALVGLAGVADRRAAGCSQGMQRRTDLARAVLTEPLLLLLDEAHTGLDSSSAPLVEALMAQVAARGGASVVVSHDRPRLTAAVDRLVEITGGRAVENTVEDAVVSVVEREGV
ncbi:ABC heme exporter, ATPase subunit [Streptomyces zinciresistens K42]|uniref:ABC heme exporter, ATPase subunit n=1 Tax=Streptomyces zinciresistens K42 TaxID=700597 RepID=G2GM57_9ACTN|nr:heme ABC exporter ATP-binding protein CcmA [Streptomyces zinciresistens]EGX55404.1 ABC heme exporter, ATPase subunit [Streptomyces zinciresistens K42]